MFSQKLGCFLLFWCGSVLAESAETLFEATYRSKHSGIKLTITRSLKALENNTYVYATHGKGTMVSLNEASTFALANSTFRPLDYSYKRRIFGIGKKESIHFDWEKAEATYNRGKSKRFVHSLTGGVLDSALYQLKLQMDLYAGKKEKIVVRYLQKDKLREREFAVSSHTDFVLDGKRHRALLVTRLNEKKGKKTEIVVLPDSFFQIAEIRQTQKNGEVYETRLTNLTYHNDLMTKFYSNSKI